MHHNTPSDPPSSEFPFSPCQQRAGVHVLNLAPAQTLKVCRLLRLRKTAKRPLACALVVITMLSAACCAACKHRGMEVCCGGGWLNETRLGELEQYSGTRDQSTADSMWSLQGTACACALAPSPGQSRSRAREREGEEDRTGSGEC